MLQQSKMKASHAFQHRREMMSTQELIRNLQIPTVSCQPIIVSNAQVLSSTIIIIPSPFTYKEATSIRVH
jgi:hypothetical protein